MSENEELLEKIKNAKNGPEQAKRRIEALDKMVFSLKSRRQQCGDATEKDTKSLSWIDKEIERINYLYNPLCQRLQEKEEMMASVEQNLQLAEKTMHHLTSQTKICTRSGSTSNSHMQKKHASSHLRDQRGFGVEKSSTYYRSSAKK